jgi:YggT family protein
VIVDILTSVIAVVRLVFFWGFVVVAVLAVLDWLVRTRRLNPFGRPARTIRRLVDPALMPIERRVVRAGGLPANAPLWALVVIAIAGVVVIAALTFVRDQVAAVVGSREGGPRGVYRLLVTWAVLVLQVAIIVRVLQSWMGARPGAWYARWSYRLTEPMLKPLRNLIPFIGMVDITPIVAWVLLSVIEAVLLGVW